VTNAVITRRDEISWETHWVDIITIREEISWETHWVDIITRREEIRDPLGRYNHH